MPSSYEEIPFEAVFQQSLNPISVHTIVLDEAGRPVDYVFDAVNRGFETHTGLKAAEVLGRSVKEVLPGTEQVWIERYGHVALTGEPHSFTSFSQELGRWYEVTAFRHKPLGFTVSFTDTTSTHRAGEALRDSQERLARVLEGSQLGYWDWDLVAGQVLRNRRWAEMLGYTLEEVEFTVRQWSDLQHPDDRERAWRALHQHLEGHTDSYRAEYRMRCKDGTYKWILDQASVVRRDGEGKPLQMSGTHTDVTEWRVAERERAALQAQLQHSQKMENLGSLAGGVAHDMNNVLAAILTLASAQLQRREPSDPVYHCFETISKAAQRGGKVVKSLLEFARQTPAEEKPVDWNELIRDQAKLLERTTLAQVELSVELDPQLGLVVGDVGALSHALMNLCVNAVDAMPEGGRLALRSRREGEFAVIEVQDSGTGMSAEVRGRAFDPFFTTKPVGKGTGLGLSLVYSTVQAHRGSLEVMSELGQGTLFRLRFPLAATLNDAHAVELSLSQPPFRPVTILLVDDDELIRSALSDLLSGHGHRLIAASGGEDALHLVGGDPRPDVVILDLNMPGLTGAQTLTRLRTLHPDLPVLLSTGRADQVALNLVNQFRNVTLLPKPYTSDELEQLLSQVTAVDARGGA